MKTTATNWLEAHGVKVEKFAEKAGDYGDHCNGFLGVIIADGDLNAKNAILELLANEFDLTDMNPSKFLTNPFTYPSMAEFGKAVESKRMQSEGYQKKKLEYEAWRLQNPEEAAKRDSQAKEAYTKYDGIGTNGSDRYYA